MKKVKFWFKTPKGKKYCFSYGKPRFTYKKRRGKNRTVRLRGVCYSDDYKHPKIIIDDTLSARQELPTIIEEFIHSYFFEKPEKEVRPLATLIAKTLYKTGWRKTL